MVSLLNMGGSAQLEKGYQGIMKEGKTWKIAISKLWEGLYFCNSWRLEFLFGSCDSFVAKPFEWIFQFINIKFKNLKKLYLWIFLVQTKVDFLVQGHSAPENTDIHQPVPQTQVLLLSATTRGHGRRTERATCGWVAVCLQGNDYVLDLLVWTGKWRRIHQAH